MVGLLEKADASGIGFEDHQDALDHGDEAIEHTYGLNTSYRLGTIKSYIQGDCEIVLRVSLRSETIDLIFHAIPKRVLGLSILPPLMFSTLMLSKPIRIGVTRACLSRLHILLSAHKASCPPL